LTVWFSEDVFDQWYYQGPKRRGAQLTYTDLVIETALTLKAVFRLGFRQSQGLLASMLRLLNVDRKVPNYTTLCRRQKTLSVTLGTVRPAQTRHVVIDSTGLKVYCEGEWKEAIWPELKQRLHERPEMTAKVLFKALQQRYRGQYAEGQLRTLQRRVRAWRMGMSLINRATPHWLRRGRCRS